jgi:hypothetical protein
MNQNETTEFSDLALTDDQRAEIKGGPANTYTGLTTVTEGTFHTSVSVPRTLEK